MVVIDMRALSMMREKICRISMHCCKQYERRLQAINARVQVDIKRTRLRIPDGHYIAFRWNVCIARDGHWIRVCFELKCFLLLGIGYCEHFLATACTNASEDSAEKPEKQPHPSTSVPR
jgi:hypothetical protein